VERLAAAQGLADRLHLWPDKSLGNLSVVNSMARPKKFMNWLNRWWQRVSEWPM
jgi:hypothetical protein